VTENKPPVFGQGQPFWLDEPYEPRRPLEGQAAADVAIVGGGITGVSAAYLLAGRGASVVLLERDAVASGATGRNAGFLLAGIARAYGIAVKEHGRDRARLLWKLTLDNHALLREWIERERLSCLYSRNGSYTLALSDQEFRAHEKSARLLQEDGFRADLLDDTDVARLFPGSGFRGGLFNPTDGEVHPVRLVRGLAEAAERRGARLHERTRVLAIDAGPAEVAVATEHGRLTASVLLLATNAYTPLLHPYFQGPIVGVRGQMFATEPCPERLIPAPVYADFGFEYFRQLPDGRILAGGGRRAALDSELTYADRPSDAVQQAIAKFLGSCFPAAARLRVTHRWAGIMGFSCDELPNAGPVPGTVNVYVSAGYHGHGLAFAALCARAVSEMILDGKTDLPVDLFSPRRHRPE
jgi:glycine/D-amino acid oxidase-like deaminating enzyme